MRQSDDFRAAYVNPNYCPPAYSGFTWEIYVGYNNVEYLSIAFVPSNLFREVSYAKSKTKACTEIQRIKVTCNWSN